MDSATIHFIGLVLFTTQVMGPPVPITKSPAQVRELRAQTMVVAAESPTPPAPPASTRSRREVAAAAPLARPWVMTEQVVAILPRVASAETAVEAPHTEQARSLAPPPTHQHTRSAAIRKAWTPPPHVEDHMALIAFEPADVVAVTGWTVHPLGTTAFQYIELTGEQISFLADGNNNVAIRDPRLGHTGGAQLKAAYQPPYPGASAVFLIPKGELFACASSTAGTQGRIDTKLKLNNLGTLTLQAPGKTLVLQGNANVVVANVPFAWAATRSQTHSGLPHYNVYCGMTGQTPCSSSVVQPSSTQPSPQPIASCADNHMRIPDAGEPSLPDAVATDVFCSNSQWP
ncbi:MAG: hypothetical protein ABI779_17155 [Acidobacteriota bacterium]